MKHWPALIVRFTPSTATEATALEELVAAALDDLRPTAIQESGNEWRVFFGTTGDRDLAAQALPVAAPGTISVEPIDVPDEDWARRSQQELTPVHVGRVTIAPPWQAGATLAQEGREAVSGAAPDAEAKGRAAHPITIVIQPSMGFGTGHHASTRLCTALLQQLDLGGKTVLDIGTGSGVLALVARALGARFVLAVDDDSDAVEAAQENLDLNGATSGIELRVADFRTLPPHRFDVVTANLTGSLLARGAAIIAQAVAAGGSLIVSGVLREEEPEVMAAFAPAFAPVQRLSEDEWIGVLLERQ